MRIHGSTHRSGWALLTALAIGGCRNDAPANAPDVAPPVAAEGSDAAPLAVDANCPRGLSALARCGTVTVFENRNTSEGRTIDLAYVVVPARDTDNAEADPVFVLAGGPGQAATQVQAIAQTVLREVSQTRPLVFVDQRGTGSSNGLQCTPTDLDAMLRGPWHDDNKAFLDECRAGLSADLAQYATPTAMDDLEDVRVALGYDEINLWGGSYGTRAALAYVRQYGEHVRSAVLWGVAPPGEPFMRTFAPQGQAALDRLLGDCAADSTCAALLPDGAATLDRILTRLAESPANIKVNDPRTGQETTIHLTPEAFVDGVRLVLYDATWSAALPAMLAAADKGNFDPLMSLMVPLTVGILTQIHLGMFLSVACSEDVPLLTTAHDDAARGTFVGGAPLDGLRMACEQWPRASLPAGYLAPVRSDVPVLLMAGEIDPVTPPQTAREAAQTLTRSRVVAFPNVGHGTSNAGDCESSLVGAFISKPDPEALDASCAKGLVRPPFVVPPG
ncbi:MAG: alpha/beta hydrolase [Deltaproteobacteria bacterium]|nr:alpha/beta hydrolase [Deltaproteobacteria bacterium]